MAFFFGNGGGGFPFGGPMDDDDEDQYRKHFQCVTLTLEHFMGGRGGPAREKKKVDNERFYQLLNVSKDATPEQIKKAFRTIAIKEHPDKGGDPEKVSE
jgi:hypothetical protein